MSMLTYEQLKHIGYSGYLLKTAPERVMQFGEGNFLRAFVDYWFDLANERADWNGKCVLVAPIPSSPVCSLINQQQGLYTLYLRGLEQGRRINQKRVISSVSRCIDPYTSEGFDAMMELAVSDSLEYIVSNTTEAGIAFDASCRLEDKPCTSFPGKLTQVLYTRYLAGKSGLVILPCELIDSNGKALQDCIDRYIALWQLEQGFSQYVHQACTFCSTLVDRIVPGAIRDPQELSLLEEENQYHDSLIDVGEVFGVWNIQGPDWLAKQLPFDKAGVNCPVVPDVTPYKQRKVRILNGAHTGFVLGAYLAGFDIVRICMENPTIRAFMNTMLYREVIPTLPPQCQQVEEFAAAVQDRFSNPFIDHSLLSISLNSTSKWKARILPTLLDYLAQFHTLPPCLAMSFAAYIAFYSSDLQGLTEQGLLCRRSNGDSYLCCDQPEVLQLYYDSRSHSDQKLVHTIMTQTSLWGMDLTTIPDFEATTLSNLKLIREKGILWAYAHCCGEEAPNNG